MAVYVGCASIDENGNAHGGQAGNQNGHEVIRQRWYVAKLGWRVLRPIDSQIADRIAQDMEYAIANRGVGYDQWERNSLYKYASWVGFDISKVTTPCETDCSALVRVCCAYAGVMGLGDDFRTHNEAARLLGTGEFVELTGSDYTEKSKYLRRGDILVTKTSGHTVVVLNDGSKANEQPTREDENTVTITLSILKRGAKGGEVWTLQTILRAMGYNLGVYGVDSDFGGATESAVKQYQKTKGLEADGVVGEQTWNKLIKG